jgi:hypothetical protein
VANAHQAAVLSFQETTVCEARADNSVTICANQVDIDGNVNIDGVLTVNGAVVNARRLLQDDVRRIVSRGAVWCAFERRWLWRR